MKIPTVAQSDVLPGWSSIVSLGSLQILIVRPKHPKEERVVGFMPIVGWSRIGQNFQMINNKQLGI